MSMDPALMGLMTMTVTATLVMVEPTVMVMLSFCLTFRGTTIVRFLKLKIN